MNKPKFLITPWVEETSDGKFHVVVASIIQKENWRYEQGRKIIATFDTFAHASEYAVEYYNKQKEA